MQKNHYNYVKVGYVPYFGSYSSANPQTGGDKNATKNRTGKTNFIFQPYMQRQQLLLHTCMASSLQKVLRKQNGYK